MSDNPYFALALGYLAAGPATETAATGALMLTRALQRQPGSQVDVNGLLNLVQEQEQHIARQDHLIAHLRQISLEWQDYGTRLKAKNTKLEEWADWAEQELKKYQNKG